MLRSALKSPLQSNLQSVMGIADTVVSHTVSNQTFDFGALTNDQDGAYTVVPNSGTISSITIDSGDSGGDYETSGATIRPAVGSTAPSAVLSCTATFSDASTDTFTATITSVANTFSVADIDELTTVTNGTLTYGQIIQLRDGVYNNAEADKRIQRAGSAISGTLANLITIKPDTGATATIRFIRIDNGSGGGGNGFRFENIVFERATDAASSPCVALQFGIDTLEFEGCTFRVADGTTGDNSSGLHFTNNGNALTNLTVNNCLFENLYDGINSPGDSMTITNNTFREIYNDCIHQSGDAAITPDDVVIEHNLFYDKKYAGAGAHGDFIQFNWGTAVNGPVTGLIVRNNKLWRGEGSSGDTDGQGIFIPGLASGYITGAIIENNFYLGTFVNGILVNDLQNSRIVGNTALWDINADDGAATGTTLIDTGNGDGNLIADNIANGYDDTGSTSSTTTNNGTISNNTTAYSAVFDSPLYDGDLTPANLYSSYANKSGGSTANATPEQGGIKYTVIGGQNGSGAVDHPRSQTVTGLSYTDVTGATTSTLYDTAAVQLTGIGSNGALVTVSGDDSPEFRIRNAADSADVVAWGTADAIIDNNERLELRETSSASNSTAVNSTVTVGKTSDTWTVTTVSGDVTAPVLSSASVGSLTSVGGTLTISTDEGNGTLYWMVDTNASRTAAQVKTGGGVDSGSQAVSATGAQSGITSTGGSASTGYYFHAMHEDAAGNQSTVSSTSFTTTAAGYSQNVLYFDGVFGSNLLRSSAMSTVTDTKEFTVSAWFTLDGAGGTEYILSLCGGRVVIVRVGTALRVRMQNASGTTIYERDYSVGSGAVAKTHVLCSADLAAGTDYMYINGVDAGGSATTLTNDTIDWTNTANSVCARSTSFDTLQGKLADPMAHNGYLDISNSTIRARFIDGSGNPVDPGSDGSTAMGTQPVYALIGQNAATLEAGASGVGNVGYGGDFPVQASYVSGGITDSSF